MAEQIKYQVKRSLIHDGVLYGPGHKKQSVEMTAEQAELLLKRGILVLEQPASPPPPPPSPPDDPEPGNEQGSETNTAPTGAGVKKSGKGKK